VILVCDGHDANIAIHAFPTIHPLSWCDVMVENRENKPLEYPLRNLPHLALLPIIATRFPLLLPSRHHLQPINQKAKQEAKGSN